MVKLLVKKRPPGSNWLKYGHWCLLCRNQDATLIESCEYMAVAKNAVGTVSHTMTVLVTKSGANNLKEGQTETDLNQMDQVGITAIIKTVNSKEQILNEDFYEKMVIEEDKAGDEVSTIVHPPNSIH